MRDVNNGWFVRYLHSNTASAFFLLVYLHVGRGIYYASYKIPRVLVWVIGAVILIVMMAIISNIWPNCLGEDQVKYISTVSTILPFNKNRTKAIKRIGPHNLNVLSVIICGMIGDWWGDKIKGNQIDSVRFNVEQSVKNSAYIHHLNILLHEWGYCSTVTPKLVIKSKFYTAAKDKLLKNEEDIVRYNYRLTTYSFTSLLWIYNYFYQEVNGIKVKRIPEWVEEFITPMGLAHLIMEDGHRQMKQGVSIATNCFSYEDCVFLSKILDKKYGLKTSVVKSGNINQWDVNIWKRSMSDLVSIVKPYIIDEMKYKLKGYI